MNLKYKNSRTQRKIPKTIYRGRLAAALYYIKVTIPIRWKSGCQQREGAGPMSGTLHLAQAQSNRGRRGRKKDFPDAERLVKRFVAQELILSLVPDVEQRLWRTVMPRFAGWSG